MHASFIVYAREALQERLPPGLIARIEERVYVDIPREGISRVIYPDVRIKEIFQPFTSGGGTATATATALEEAVATATRIIVELEEKPITETYIEMVDLAGGQVVTVIEVLNISDKVPGAGQGAYRQKQKGLLEARVNLVEIDLLRSGGWVLSMPESSLAPSQHTPYMVCVFHATQPRRREVYPIFSEPAIAQYRYSPASNRSRRSAEPTGHPKPLLPDRALPPADRLLPRPCSPT